MLYPAVVIAPHNRLSAGPHAGDHCGIQRIAFVLVIFINNSAMR